MKKIMFFRPLYYMGGTEMAVLNLVKNLKGFDIYIGYSDPTSDKKLLSSFNKYAKVVNINDEKIDVDIFITSSVHYHLVDAIKNINMKKRILWIHHLVNFDNSSLNIKEEMEKIDLIISVSETLTNKLKKLFKNLENKIYTIYNIINVDEIKEKSNEKINLDLSKTLNLVTVSRVCKEKGFDRMFFLAKCLKDENIDFKWYIIGDNYYKEEFNKIYDKYKIFQNNFVWFGFLDNPFNIVKQCDYSVLLSDDETWGLVITEAMVLGVPCITTNFDVAYEQITDKKTGIILEKENLDMYKSRIKDIIDNKNKYKKAISNFSYDNKLFLNQWEDILNNE